MKKNIIVDLVPFQISMHHHSPIPTLFFLLSVAVVLSSRGYFVASQLQVPMTKADRPLMDPISTPPQVTHLAYMDVYIQGNEYKEEDIGRIIFGLFGHVAPKTVENFYGLCHCDKGYGKYSQKLLCYKNTTFHRIIPNFIVQGGDITHDTGIGGESIFGGKFEDESFVIPHNKRYLLSMANSGKNNNGSQFFINTVKTSWLDGRYVVFGMVVDGFNVVDTLEALGTNSGMPTAKAIIVDSGILPIETLDTLTNSS